MYQNGKEILETTRKKQKMQLYLFASFKKLQISVSGKSDTMVTKIGIQ